MCITYPRLLKIGGTPECKGCEEDTYKHGKECVERFEEPSGQKEEEPAPMELLFEDVEVESIEHEPATPSSRGRDILEPPDDEEPADEGEISRPAVTADVSYGKGRDSLPCGDVL